MRYVLHEDLIKILENFLFQFDVADGLVVGENLIDELSVKCFVHFVYNWHVEHCVAREGSKYGNSSVNIPLKNKSFVSNVLCRNILNSSDSVIYIGEILK